MVSAVGGTAALFCATFAGISCAGVYIHAPDDFCYGTGQAVRRSLLSEQNRSSLILACSAIYLSIIAVWIGGPALPTIAGLPLYTMATIVFVGGFAYICCSQRLPLPEMVIVPFLILGLVYRFPDLASVGGSAIGLAAVIAARWLAGLLIVFLLAISNDAEKPRLYGVIPDETWLFFAGAAAWVGEDHILGLIVCCSLLTAMGIVVWLVYALYKDTSPTTSPRVSDLTTIWVRERHLVIPWSGLITVAMLLEMIIRHECKASVLANMLPELFSRNF